MIAVVMVLLIGRSTETYTRTVGQVAAVVARSTETHMYTRTVGQVVAVVAVVARSTAIRREGASPRKSVVHSSLPV